MTEKTKTTGCPSCGTAISKTAKYCSNCSAPVGNEWMVAQKDIDSYVQTALKKAITDEFKDQKAVELEVSERIAERVVKWAKVFGFFAGIPLAIFALFLSFLGIKTYSDLQKASSQVSTTTAQLDTARETLKVAEEKSQELINATERVEGDIEKRLKSLLASIGSIETKVNSAKARLDEIPELKKRQERLETEIREIEKRVGFEATEELTPEIQEQLEASLEKYLSYLDSVGFPSNPSRVHIKIENRPMGLAYYNGGNQTIVIDSRIVADEHVAFREYTHHVLLGESKRLSGSQFGAIESGLADYYPCSFTNNPNLGEVTARVISPGQPYIRTLENNRNFNEFANIETSQFSYLGAEIWGGAFWEIRVGLGQQAADSLLFAAWSITASTGSAEPVIAERFIAVLLDNARGRVNEEKVKGIEEILGNRGFPIR